MITIDDYISGETNYFVHYEGKLEDGTLIDFDYEIPFKVLIKAFVSDIEDSYDISIDGTDKDIWNFFQNFVEEDIIDDFVEQNQDVLLEILDEDIQDYINESIESLEDEDDEDDLH